MKLFRLARAAAPGHNLAKTLGWMVLVWIAALVVLPALVLVIEAWLGIDRFDFWGRRVLGASVFLTGSAGGLWCAFTMALAGAGTPVPFDAARQLVVSGPYRYVRNPMALTSVIQTIGVCLWTSSYGCALIPVGGALLWQLIIRPPEEEFLAKTFGRSYLDYQARVRCWIPGTGYTGAP